MWKVTTIFNTLILALSQIFFIVNNNNFVNFECQSIYLQYSQGASDREGTFNGGEIEAEQQNYMSTAKNVYIQNWGLSQVSKKHLSNVSNSYVGEIETYKQK